MLFQRKVKDFKKITSFLVIGLVRYSRVKLDMVYNAFFSEAIFQIFSKYVANKLCIFKFSTRMSIKVNKLVYID